MKEPSKWVIIKREENILTLMPDKILINFIYDRYYSYYKDSAVRKYIQEEFIPVAFTQEEIDMILPTQLEDVIDKVYIQSIEELSNISRAERIRKITPYAYSNKASGYSGFSKKEKHLEENGYY